MKRTKYRSRGSIVKVGKVGEVTGPGTISYTESSLTLYTERKGPTWPTMATGTSFRVTAMAVLSSTRSGTDGPDIPSCSRPGAAHQTPLPRDRYHLRAARRGWRARAPGRVRERPDGHAGPRSLRSTLTVLPSRTRCSFPSRASQPTPRRRSWSGSLVPCLNLISVVTPCSSRYCQIAPAASPISASMLQLSPALPQPDPARTPSRVWPLPRNRGCHMWNWHERGPKWAQVRSNHWLPVTDTTPSSSLGHWRAESR